MAEPGEVLPAGGKVLSLADLSDVYMYVFLPANTSGKLALGSEARIVLDALPEYPIRALVSYVSPSAQFTPKTVETAEERHNLSFRVKLQIDKERLRPYESMVKVGIPGMGYVRFDNNAAWPPKLQVNPNPPQLPWNSTGATDTSSPAPAVQARRAATPVRAPPAPPANPPQARPAHSDAKRDERAGCQRQGRESTLRGGHRARRHQPRHSRGEDDRLDWTGRGRQVHPARHHRRCQASSEWGGAGARWEHRRCALSYRGILAHRLFAPGPRQESLSDALDLRECRLLRPAVRPIARGARMADQGPIRQHRSHARSEIGPQGSSPAA